MSSLRWASTMSCGTARKQLLAMSRARPAACWPGQMPDMTHLKLTVRRAPDDEMPLEDVILRMIRGVMATCMDLRDSSRFMGTHLQGLGDQFCRLRLLQLLDFLPTPQPGKHKRIVWFDIESLFSGACLHNALHSRIARVELGTHGDGSTSNTRFAWWFVTRTALACRRDRSSERRHNDVRRPAM
jgi:hypothetical protein